MPSRVSLPFAVALLGAVTLSPTRPARAQTIGDRTPPVPTAAASSARLAAEARAGLGAATARPAWGVPGAPSTAIGTSLAPTLRVPFTRRTAQGINPETGSWETTSRTERTYQDGHVAEETTAFLNGTAWDVTDRTLYSYDGGRRTRVETHGWSQIAGAFVPQERQDLSYDGALPALYVYRIWTGSAWKDSTRTHFTSDGAALLSRTEEVWDGRAWTTRIHATRAARGANVEETGEETGADGHRVTVRNTFFDVSLADLTRIELARMAELFEDSGTMLDQMTPYSQQVDTLAAGAWSPVSRVVGTWTSTGRPLTTRIESYQGGAWRPSYALTATYDGDVATQVVLSISGRPFMQDVFRYTDGRLSEARTDVLVNGPPEPTSRLLYEYGTTSAASRDAEPPPLRLAAPAPNPTAATATVGFTLDRPGEATIDVLDLTGRRVATLARGSFAAGTHTAALDAAGLAPGLYVVRLSAGGHVATRSLAVVR